MITGAILMLVGILIGYTLRDMKDDTKDAWWYEYW